MARQFVSASGHYLEIGTGVVVTAAPVTLACWFYADTLHDSVAVSLSKSGLGVEAFLLEPWSDGVVYATTGGGGVSTSYAGSSTTYSAGGWNHACAVFTSGTSRAAYLNGGGKGTNTVACTPAGIDNTNVGCYFAAGARSTFFNGRLAEVGIWNAALTDAEVLSLARGFAPSMVRSESLVNYLPLHGRNSPEPDWYDANDGFSVSGATQGAHPPKMIYPASRRYFFPLAAIAPAVIARRSTFVRQAVNRASTY